MGFWISCTCSLCGCVKKKELRGPGCVVGELFVLVEARMNKIIGHDIHPQFRVHYSHIYYTYIYYLLLVKFVFTT